MSLALIAPAGCSRAALLGYLDDAVEALKRHATFADGYLYGRLMQDAAALEEVARRLRQEEEEARKRTDSM